MGFPVLNWIKSWFKRPVITIVKVDDDSEGEIKFPREFAEKVAMIDKEIKRLRESGKL